MSLFNSDQYMDYPAVWVQVRLSGTGGGDRGFWIAAPSDNGGSGIPGQVGSPEWNDTPSTATPLDSTAMTSLLEAIKTWADGYSWGGSLTVQWVKAMQVSESYSDVSPS